MEFHTCPEKYGCFIGSNEWNRPSVPIKTEGEIYIPDSITAPDGQRLPVRWISRGCFRCLPNVTKIRLPYTIEYLSDYSFQDCTSLREINLPDSLKIIFPYAFRGCNALQRIVLQCPKPPFDYEEPGYSKEVLNIATVVSPPASEKAYNKTDHIYKFFRYHANLLPAYPKQQP